MDNIKEKLEKHLSHEDYLSKEDVLNIIYEKPEFKFEGEAYRILLFSNPTKECDISEDSSFSYDQSGIKYYFWKQDINYYPYAHLYKANIIGLDFLKIAEYYNLKNTDMIYNEREIILGELKEQELIYNGESNQLDNIL